MHKGNDYNIKCKEKKMLQLNKQETNKNSFRCSRFGLLLVYTYSDSQCV